MDAKNDILNNKTALGIELGSTRIKAVLIGSGHNVLASGVYAWENKFEGGLWTYSLEDIWQGVQECYRRLKAEVKSRYGITLAGIGAIGISAMMHGYMVFDKSDKLLVPFRTWRNNNAEDAAKELTELFGFNIPARWSIAHLYHAVTTREPHTKDIAFQTTLEGYIHYMLTGQKVIGIGEASGMFPVDKGTKQYDSKMVGLFDALSAVRGMPWTLLEIFPKILLAGQPGAGSLTEKGALLLDPDGDLKPGIPFCPPEGDAGTGMVATNSVRPKTGNVSAGTSIFGMIVLENDLKKVHPEIDIVMTPSGDPVAMVHCNNCTSELNAWIKLFKEYNALMGLEMTDGELFDKLLYSALEGDAGSGGLLVYNYTSGENITDVKEGRPMLMRTNESDFSLSNFMRAQLSATVATLKIGLDILFKEENVKVDTIYGHGGIFKTEGVFQRILAAAINAPVATLKTANEGGAWGMAVLAMFSAAGGRLDEYLDDRVFAGADKLVLSPEAGDVGGMNDYVSRFVRGLPVVRRAVDALKEDSDA